jgi:phosphocarrier protein HPr
MVERSATTLDYFTCNCDWTNGNQSAPALPDDQPMQTRQVHVANRLGLHARLAAQIVHLASTFSSNVSLAFKGRQANARNVLAVMLLAASVGSTISIEVSGPDEAEALEALTSLIEDRPAAGRPV